MSWQSVVNKIWYPDPADGRPSLPLPARILAPAARLYASAIRCRNMLHERSFLASHALPCPVISVGNITVGGTGKTPMTILLAHLLVAEGRRPAILSRGYGGRSRAEVNVVSDGTRVVMDPRDAGDEPVLMARELPGVPVLTGSKRVLTGRAALDRFGVDCLLLDDAFQHRQIRRDLDIVLLDSRSPAGNGLTLPAGPLREPLDGLNRADCLVLTGGKTGFAARQIPQAGLPEGVPFYSGQHRPRDLIRAASAESLPLDHLRGKQICAFAGIAHPEGFQRSIAALGGNMTSFLAFPDHHGYTERDIDAIEQTARKGRAEIIVTTEKDGIKLAAFSDFTSRLFILRITLEISGGPVDFALFLRNALATWKRQEQRP